MSRCARPILIASTVLVLLAVLSAPPMAFGIAMTPADPNELISTDDPYLYLLIAVVSAAVCALVGAWSCLWSAPGRARLGIAVGLGLLAATFAGAVVGVAAVDLVASAWA